MSDPVIIAIIGVILALINAPFWVEVIKAKGTRRQMAAQSDAIVAAVTPNSGKSLRDAVDRLNEKVDGLGVRVADIATEQAVQRAILEERKGH